MTMDEMIKVQNIHDDLMAEIKSLRALLAARKANEARLIEICRRIASGLRGKYVTRENMWKLAESAYEANAQNET